MEFQKKSTMLKALKKNKEAGRYSDETEENSVKKMYRVSGNEKQEGVNPDCKK
mgnify:FL=1